MFSYSWCSGSEFSITDCSGGISSAIVTCGQNVQGVQCRGKLLYIPHKNVHAGAFRKLLVGFVKPNVCAVCCGSAIFSSKLLYICLYCNLQCHCFLVIVNAVVW